MNLLAEMYGTPAFDRAPRRTALSWLILLPFSFVFTIMAAATAGVRPHYEGLSNQTAASLEHMEGVSRVDGTYKLIRGGKGHVSVCLVVADGTKNGKLRCTWAPPVYATHRMKLNSLEGQPGFGYQRKGFASLVSMYRLDGAPVVLPENYISNVKSSYRFWVAFQAGSYGLLGLSLLLQISQLVGSRKTGKAKKTTG